MTLVERLTAILLKPKRTWLQVEAERAAVAGFVVPLAGICGLALIIDRFAPKVSATQN